MCYVSEHLNVNSYRFWAFNSKPLQFLEKSTITYFYILSTGLFPGKIKL
jgi:hypothetical protein